MLGSLAADWHPPPPPQPSVAILARYYKTRTVQASRPPYQLRMMCTCSGCSQCTVWEGSWCWQNIGKYEKSVTEPGKQMCVFCAKNRDHPDPDESGAGSSKGNGKGLFKGVHGPSSSSSSQLEQRVGMVEAQIQSIQPSLPQVLQQLIDLRENVGYLQTLVESLQQRLDRLSQRVVEVEATVESWQDENWRRQW